MRTELIDIADLSDSREVMSQKTPRPILSFVLIVTILLVVALVFSYFGRIETYVKASGEIRPAEAVSTITAIAGGEISKVLKQDGSIVNVGDVLLQFDCTYYEQQREIFEVALSEKTENIQSYRSLIAFIRDDVNGFDENENSFFYHQYCSYKSELENAISQIESSNQQIQASIKDLDQAIENVQLSLKTTTQLYNDYLEFYKAVDNDKTYRGSNQTLVDLYNHYQISLDKAEAVYNGYVTQYEEICIQRKENPSLITQSQVDQVLYARDAAHADLQAVKSSLLLQVNETIDNLNQQIINYQATIAEYTAKKETLIVDTDTEIVKTQIKQKYYLNVNNTINALNQEIASLEEQLLSITHNIEQASVIAQHNGILIYSQEYLHGDIISSGTVIATIVPTTELFRVVMYIPEYNIAQVSEGQTVEYVVRGVSNIDYGKIYGTITEISGDSFVDQTTGQKFYKAVATLPNTTLRSDEGETIELKSGMMVEIRAITGDKRILTWLLEKLNFL